MKVFLIGHLGWIGMKYQNLFKTKGIEYKFSSLRADDNGILSEILESKSTHVLCCTGRTHGTRDGKTYTTIDYLEDNSMLRSNVQDNLFVPLQLALFCDKHNIHFTYIGTGCIFDKFETIDTLNYDFSEDDTPNFFGSNYSIVKGFTDRLLHLTNALNLRIRMPITDEVHPRNFITKITSYSKVVNIFNSMTVLDELIPISFEMMIDQRKGTYNFTNPGLISHNMILNMYKEIVDPNFAWENFNLEEQDKILLSKRSNNELCTQKLESEYSVDNIEVAVKKALIRMKDKVKK